MAKCLIYEANYKGEIQWDFKLVQESMLQKEI
jgi:hypothetical protein